jgi:hypothetical protein
MAALPGSPARRHPLVWDRGNEPVPNPDKVARSLAELAGRLVSELIVGGKTSIDISALRFSRFAEGAIGRPRNVL